jgi:TfoX/Sxy family transcriptional regulator of competence genes
MAYDEALVERVGELLADVPGVSDKRMFGGIAFLIDGLMTVAVTHDDLMVRVGKPNEERALARPGARQVEMKGRPMGGWIVVDGAALDDEALSGWVTEAREFVATLPPKP